MAQNNNIDLGDDIIDNRLCSNTKTQYKRKVKHFFEWIGENHPEIINDTHDAGEDISIEQLKNLESDTFKEFFGHICKKKKRDGSYIDPIQYQSFQHVSGYKSAIKDYNRSKRTLKWMIKQ
jgi:hypothetical protein